MAYATGELQLSEELVEIGYNSVEEIPGFVQRRHELGPVSYTHLTLPTTD